MLYSLYVMRGIIYDIISSSHQEPAEVEVQDDHATEAIIELIRQDREAREVPQL